MRTVNKLLALSVTAAALGVSMKQIGVKATTNELMGFIGREEGIAAMAVASLDCS